MSAKIIVSYDGTANEDDAIALGRTVRPRRAPRCRSRTCATRTSPTATARRSPRPRPRSCSSAAPRCSAPAQPGRPPSACTSSPIARRREGLGALAEREGADVIVFCSDSHTAKGHVSVGNSAERLLDGRPHGDRDRARRPRRAQTRARGRSSRSATGTAARARPPRPSPARWTPPLRRWPTRTTDLLVVDSRPDAEQGRVSISSSAAHLIEIATSSVLVLPRGVTVPFGKATAAAGRVAPSRGD